MLYAINRYEKCFPVITIFIIYYFPELRIESRALRMLGKCAITLLSPKPYPVIIFRAFFSVALQKMLWWWFLGHNDCLRLMENPCMEVCWRVWTMNSKPGGFSWLLLIIAIPSAKVVSATEDRNKCGGRNRHM